MLFFKIIFTTFFSEDIKHFSFVMNIHDANDYRAIAGTRLRRFMSVKIVLTRQSLVIDIMQRKLLRLMKILSRFAFQPSYWVSMVLTMLCFLTVGLREKSDNCSVKPFRHFNCRSVTSWEDHHS